jgi:S1-C subfamily serine protease
VQAGDQVVAVGGERVVTLADFLRQTWSKGPAGTEIALTLARSGAPVYIRVSSGDRNDFLRKSSLQ